MRMTNGSLIGILSGLVCIIFGIGMLGGVVFIGFGKTESPAGGTTQDKPLLPSVTARLKVLSESMKAEDFAEIHELIKSGADVNVKNKYGVTPLFMASEKGLAEIVKLLLETKADVNTSDKTNGATPLLVASANGYIEIVKYLLEAKADVNVVLKTEGANPLYMASQNGHTEVVKILLEANANVNAKVLVGGKDCTPLSIAKEKDNDEIIRDCSVNTGIF
jgi:ankyrin repeat protein